VRGSPDSGSPINFDWEAHKPDPRKIAMLRVMTGVPGLMLSLFSLLFTYRYLEKPMGDLVFWVVLSVILFVFVLYFGIVWRNLRRGLAAQASRDVTEGGKT